MQRSWAVSGPRVALNHPQHPGARLCRTSEKVSGPAGILQSVHSGHFSCDSLSSSSKEQSTFQAVGQGEERFQTVLANDGQFTSIGLPRLLRSKGPAFHPCRGLLSNSLQCKLAPVPVPEKDSTQLLPWRQLSTCWSQEKEIRNGRWNVSQPIWHPPGAENQGGWSLSDLFKSHQWLVWVGKGLVTVASTYLTWQGGLWVTCLVGACRGAHLANPAANMSSARKMWEVAKGLLSRHYTDAGHQAVHCGDNDVGGGAGDSGGHPFNLAHSSET